MTQDIEDYAKALRWSSEAEVPFNERDWEHLDGSTPASWGDMIMDLLADEVKAGRCTREEADAWAIVNVP